MGLGIWRTWYAVVLAALAFAPEAIADTLDRGCIANEIQSEMDTAGRLWSLGATAFFDRNLSRDRSIACADCHDPNYSYSNPSPLRDVSSGVAARRAPSLLNLRDHRWFFWDGRAQSLETAVLHPLYGTNELNLDRATMAERVREDKKYDGLIDYVALQKGSVNGTRPNITDEAIETAVAESLASFLKTLVSCKAAKPQDLSSAVTAGAILFQGKGNCSNCHFGRNFTDGQFHNIRVRPTREFEEPDSGRYQVVKTLNANGAKLKLTQEMWGSFKTPSLRNVARHPPYMHQGQFATLTEVVAFYSEFENALPEDHHYAGLLRPLQLSETEIAQLTAYLQSLNDDYYTCVVNAGGKLSPGSCSFGD